MIVDILRFLIAVLVLNAPVALARDPEIIVTTHTYKKVGNLKINLDLDDSLFSLQSLRD